MSTPTAAEQLWWRSPFRTFQTNLREIDAGLDVEAVLDFLEDFGANVWLLSVGGIVSNYPTALPVQTPNPVLAERASGDLVGDAVAASARRGIRVLARMDFSKVDRRRAQAHPTWCFVNADGEHQVYNDLVSVCPSAPYYQRHVFEVLTEVLTRYPISGFFLNWMSFNEVDYSRTYWGVCHCRACQDRFAAYAPGVELPADRTSPTYAIWRRFAHDTLEDLTAAIRAHVRGLAPEAALILGDRADIVFHEANNAVGRPLWHHRTSESVSAAKAYRPRVPVLVNSVGFVDMPYRLAGEDPNHFAQYLIQAIAHGAVPSTYVMGGPSESPYANLEVAAQITRFYRDNAAAYTGLRPDAAVLLVRPDALAMSSDRIAGATSEFQGLYLALTEAHIPFDVLSVARVPDLTASAPDVGTLARYAVVLLPDLGPLEGATVTALDSYVAGGGAILGTGSSGLHDGVGQLAGSPALRHTASFATTEATRSLHVRLGATAQAPLGHLAPVVGAFYAIEPAPETTVAMPTLGPAPYGPPEKCYGYTESAHPGYLERAAGSGTIGMLPWTAGRVYREVGLTAVRDAVVERVVGLGAPRIRTGLPEQVQVVRGRSAVGTVLHLLNRTGDASQRFLAPIPIGPSWLELPWDGPTPQVRALVRDDNVRAELDDGVLRVEVPMIDRFEVLVLLDSLHDFVI